jgi:hypothetical protein
MAELHRHPQQTSSVGLYEWRSKDRYHFNFQQEHLPTLALHDTKDEKRATFEA